MQRKHIYFIITALPALFLLLLVALTARDIFAIRRIDPAEISLKLKGVLAQRGRLSFPLPDETFITDRSKRAVFVFGSSDLILSDGGVFPSYLEQRHKELRVVNFGISGLDSFMVKQRVFEALAVAKPDVLILFFGHNDYNEAYHNCIMPAFFEKFDFLLRIPYVFSKNKPVSPFASTDEYYWYARLQRPRIYRLFQQLGLLEIKSRDFEPVNTLILDYYIQNCEAILDLASSNGIPVVLITPVGNLHAEPFGDLHTTTAFYRQGIAEKDYARSIELLKRAKDTEIFTYDLRAKSDLIRYIRNLERPKVYVLDLEKKLEEMRFGFGKSDFMDYVHFNDSSHRLLADIIFNYLKQNNLTAQKTQ